MSALGIVLTIVFVISGGILWLVAESDASTSSDGGCVFLIGCFVVMVASLVGLYFTGDLLTVLAYVG